MIDKVEIDLFGREKEKIDHDKLRVHRIEFYLEYLKCIWIYESDRWTDDELITERGQYDNVYWVFKDTIQLPLVLYSNSLKAYALNLCDMAQIPTIYFKTKKEAMAVAEKIVQWKVNT